MGFDVSFPYMDTLCNDQIRLISIGIASNINHFFVVKCSKSSLIVILKYTLHYFQL
jgi:hypothetical protein